MTGVAEARKCKLTDDFMCATGAGSALYFMTRSAGCCWDMIVVIACGEQGRVAVTKDAKLGREARTRTVRRNGKRASRGV